MKLTDTQLRGLKPTGKLQRLSDGAGLTLEVRPTGRMYWRLRYRFEGKASMVSLGEYPTVKLKVARSKADAARAQISDGIDPAAEKREARQAIEAAEQERITREAYTFEQIARDWFERIGSKDLSESHAIRQMRRLEIHVFPWIGDQQIDEIRPKELLTVMRRVADGGSLETAHRIRVLCGQVFRYAIGNNDDDDKDIRDITQDLKGLLPAKKSNVFAAITEPQEIGPMLRALHGYSGTLPVQCALKLAPLVYCRPGELRYAKWGDIDLKAAQWSYNASKTHQQHIVPLSRQAIGILCEIHRLTGDREYVFPSARATRPGEHERPMSENTVNAALRRLDIPKDVMSGHGFRAMARTVLDEVLGFPPNIIEHQLAHAVKDANGRSYNRTTFLPQRREMMQAWADYLDQLRAGADVLQMTDHRKAKA